MLRPGLGYKAAQLGFDYADPSLFCVQRDKQAQDLLVSGIAPILVQYIA
jgi:hypothetical protein